GGELELRLVALERPVDLDEDLLAEVESGFAVSDHAEDEARNGPVVALDELFEAVGLARHGPGDQVAIRERCGECGRCYSHNSRIFSQLSGLSVVRAMPGASVGWSQPSVARPLL